MGLLQGTVCLKQLKQGCRNVTVAPAITSHTQGQCTDLKKKKNLAAVCYDIMLVCSLQSRSQWMSFGVWPSLAKNCCPDQAGCHS